MSALTTPEFLVRILDEVQAPVGLEGGGGWTGSGLAFRCAGSRLGLSAAPILECCSMCRGLCREKMKLEEVGQQSKATQGKRNSPIGVTAAL
jgi:hypothetical protein